MIRTKFFVSALFILIGTSCNVHPSQPDSLDKSTVTDPTNNGTEKCIVGMRFLADKSVCAGPIGNDCFRGSGELGGQFNERLVSPPVHESNQVIVTLRNETRLTLYFAEQISRPGHPRFTIAQNIQPDPTKKTEALLNAIQVPENEYCSQECPSDKKVMERDCGAPTNNVIALQPKESYQTSWSGNELLQVFQQCGTSNANYCTIKRPALPDIYTLRTCAYTSKPVVHAAEESMPTFCISKEFEHTRQKILWLTFTPDDVISEN